MATPEKIGILRAMAEDAGLEGLDFLDECGSVAVAREYNGIGPEWAGAAVRGKATKLFWLFEPAAVVHDLRNWRCEGGEAGFHAANGEFLRNCRRLADRAYPWWSWRRYRARAVARALFAIVEGPVGWKAWQDCERRRRDCC